MRKKCNVQLSDGSYAVALVVEREWQPVTLNLKDEYSQSIWNIFQNPKMSTTA